MVHLSDPGRPLDGLDQLVFALLEASGLTIVAAGPWALRDTVSEVARVAPFFRDSVAQGNGLATHPAHQSVWVGVDGPMGSAVMLFGAPGDSRILRITIDQLRTVDPRWQSEVAFQGDLSRRIAEYVAGAHAVAATEYLDARAGG